MTEMIFFRVDDYSIRELVHEMMADGYVGIINEGSDRMAVEHEIKRFYTLRPGETESRAYAYIYDRPQFLVRPSDNHIFEICKYDGRYDTYSMKDLSNGCPPYEHFTSEVFLSYKFFPISEQELSIYQNRFKNNKNG
jgi:hypothetical protein